MLLRGESLQCYCKVSGRCRSYTEDLDALLAHREKLLELQLVHDTPYYLFEAARAGKSVLVEGANGALLDIDHGLMTCDRSLD